MRRIFPFPIPHSLLNPIHAQENSRCCRNFHGSCKILHAYHPRFERIEFRDRLQQKIKERMLQRFLRKRGEIRVRSKRRRLIKSNCLRSRENGRCNGLFREGGWRGFQSGADDGGAGLVPPRHLPFLPALAQALGPTSTPRANSRTYVIKPHHFYLFFSISLNVSVAI